ncbi:type II toxin-antitoxin system ParD family antitoxin [Microvirga sp. 2TAF3]|uniref:type II toxin-antitoxin system ParD family antitoxin n=1 Tax=Microvirga sp. 2TAF3 TaxID=3233014 RepID=UPI003F98F762
MPTCKTRSVFLTRNFEAFIDRKVVSARHRNANHAVRSTLQLLSVLAPKEISTKPSGRQ